MRLGLLTNELGYRLLVLSDDESGEVEDLQIFDLRNQSGGEWSGVVSEKSEETTPEATLFTLVSPHPFDFSRESFRRPKGLPTGRGAFLQSLSSRKTVSDSFHSFDLRTAARFILVRMETDSFFCQLLKQMPQTLFELLGLPAKQARGYRFDSVEVKKSFRIDGLFLPRRASMPLYFVEVQFRTLATFYANLFAKVFCYLQENDPAQDWIAVAVFRSRSVEPEIQTPYEDLIQSHRVRRFYLDELALPADPPLGLGILQLVTAPVEKAKVLVARLVHKAKHEIADPEMGVKVLQLVEELLMRRFPNFDREEIRAMFDLEDLRKTRVWQEAHEEGREEGREEGHEEGVEEGQLLAKQELVLKWLAKGMTAKEIAELLEMSPQEVRRLAKSTAK